MLQEILVSPEIAEQLVDDELTDSEQSERLYLERRVERAFSEAGKALMQLRDRRLYRSTHKTFEEYCKDRFGFERRHSYRLIDASAVVDNLIQMRPNGTQAETELSEQQMCPNGLQILPTSERQVRPMTKLEPSQQQHVWQAAVQEAGGKAPSGRIVTNVMQRIIERTKVPNTYQLSEVCQITVKDNPDLRGKGGCWGIVTHVGDYSCTVMTWDGEYTVRTDHLKSMNYTDSECQDMQSISTRINTIRNSDNLEEAALAVLKHLGKLKRPYLTGLEEKMLNLIELECTTPS
ncbi:hypothetical protein [Komarekiella delphini-convector]|uniref:hypothetical protein n=1 Tax=Komarekiella delphini-convector TaxID=3050158 RepID=UPI001CD8890A|nr:hypothetical protein [Komarekiella delphini-convector]